MTRQLCEFVTERKGRDIRRGRRANHRGGRRRRRRRRDDDATAGTERTDGVYFLPSVDRPSVGTRARSSVHRSVGRSVGTETRGTVGTTVCATARGAPPDELSSGTRPPTPGVSSVRVRDDDDDDASDADDETFGRKSPPVIVREPRRVVHPVASSTPSRFRAKNDVPGSPAAEPRARFSRCSPDAYETRGRRARRAHRDEKTKHKKK